MKHKNADSLAEYFADIITSRHNQHAQVRIVGSAGSGKSWAALNLALEVSKAVARKKGGKPEDYYNFENSLAVMGKDEIKRVMTNPPQYGIIHLDDVGTGLNARRYMTQYNIDINNILTTFRPNHNLIIMTMQAGFQVDKIARVLAHYQIVMDQQLFHKGISIGKVYQIKLNHLTDEITYPFIRLNGTRYVGHVFHKPPDDIAKLYESIRAEQLKKINDEKPDEIKPSLATQREMYAEHWERLYKLGSSLRQIAQNTRCDRDTVTKYLKEVGLYVGGG